MTSHTRSPIRPIDWIIILLASATGLIHLAMGFSELSVGASLLSVSFILNGLAYLSLIVALYLLPAFRHNTSLLQWSLIALAVASIMLYFYFNGTLGLSSPLGMVTKAIELALIIIVVFDMGH